MPHHIFKIGPLDREDGDFFNFHVYPGDDRGQVYPASSEDMAFDNILHDYEATELVCEPSLVETGLKFGVRAEALSPLASHGLAYKALDRFPDRPFQGVSRQGLVYQLARAMVDFITDQGDLLAFAGRRFHLAVLGQFEFDTSVYLHGPADRGAFLTVLLDRPTEDLDILGRDMKAVRQYTHVGVDFYQEPGFILDAMRRAHALQFIPVARAFTKGNTVPINDGQLAIAAACISALAALQSDQNISTGRIDMGDLEIVANITRT